MIAPAPEDRHDLLRWVLSAAFVLAAHGGIAAAIGQWEEPVDAQEPASAIVIELAPISAAPMELPNDLAPQPEQEAIEKVEEKVEEPIEPTPPTDVAVMLPPPETKPEPPKPVEEQPPPAPAPPPRQAAIPAAPAQGRPNASTSTALPRWQSQVAGILERNKRYPSEARNRLQQGVVRLAFSIDRQGRVVSSRIVASSGSSVLDQETLDLVHRAQPFPPPPPEFPGGEIEVPVRFNIR